MRIPELMAYKMIITKASEHYRWSGRVVYDQKFWQETAGNPHQTYARVDPSINFMYSALQDRQSVLKIGLQDVSASITLHPAA